MKKVFSGLLAAIFTVSLCIITPGAFAAPDNFVSSGNYRAGQFHDVDNTSWFSGYVESAYNYGLLRGRGHSTFAPGGLLTMGEAITLAVRARNIYGTGVSDFLPSSPFYTVYVEYALENEIIAYEDEIDFSAFATRAQFASLIYRALSAEAFAEINLIPDYGINDVVSCLPYKHAIYTLYRAGILTGSDKYGTFFPNSSITRAEVAAIMTRVARPSARVSFVPPDRMSAEEIFVRNSEATLMIETFDERGEFLRIGSGFLICRTGLALTNLHVLALAESVEITLPDGQVYPMRAIEMQCEKRNLAIFSIESERTEWAYFNLGNSDLVEVGASVFVLGSPLALYSSFTDGIISGVRHDFEGSDFLQFTAPISFGSGGSPLLNARGQVIGVASSSFQGGQNLNLAVPINFARQLIRGESEYCTYEAEPYDEVEVDVDDDDEYNAA